ncbi:MAG TPA: hypothetical protein VHT03_02135 [Rhizomicrobium sp.]|jgi:hypothetical protein|nr:hypothetical protein [Rhizomicrobium sp.]
MAAVVAAALLGGGGSARAAETASSAANSAWFYTTADGPTPISEFATTGDDATSSVQLLSRFAASSPARVPVVWQSANLFGGRDLEAAAPLGRNLAVEFGTRSGNAFDFGSELYTNPAAWQPFSQTGREVHMQGSLGLGTGLALNFGESLGESDSLLPSFGPAWMQSPLAGGNRLAGTAETGFAALGWNPAPWASLGLVARQASAEASAPVAQLSPAKLSTQTLGVAGKVAFGSGWVTSFSYNEGINQLDLRPAANPLAENAQHSRSYGVAIAKHGLFGDDSLGLEVSQTPSSGFGGVDLGQTPTSDPFDGFISSATRPILSGSTPETDVQLGYVTTFLDGALALQANAGYQMNTAGQQGNNGIAVLSRAKINF